MIQPTPNYQDYYPTPDKETTLWPVMDFPFENNPIPDVYARTLERHYDVTPQGYAPKTGARTSYINQFIHTDNMNAAAWFKLTGGTGIAAVLTAGFTAPDGALVAWRLYMDRGVGTSSGDESAIIQTVGSLSNPHASAIGFWYKSNTAISQQIVIVLNTNSGSLAITLTATTAWQQYTKLDSAVPAVNSILEFRSLGTDATAQVIDILIAYPQFDIASVIGPFISTIATARTVSVPYVDGVQNASSPGSDFFAFLAKESPLKNITRATGQLERIYARIPGNQILPGSKPITRPVMDNIFSGSTYAVTFDGGLTSHLFTTRKAITAIGALTLGTVPNAIAAQALGTLPATTLDFVDSGGHTSSQALNGTKSSIQSSLASALTSLTSIFVGGSANSLVVSWVGTMKSVGTSSTVVGTSGGAGTDTGITVTAANASKTDTAAPNQNPSIRTINATAHGASAPGTRVAFWNGNGLVARSIVMSIPDADNFTVLASDVDGKDLVLTHCAFTEDAAVCYAISPPVTCTVRRTQSFYLPGYSMLASGATMASFADIPLQTPILGPQQFLDTIVAGSAWGVEDAGGISPWMGPILMQEVSEVQMADVLDSVSVLP